MELNEKALANSLAIVSGMGYILCVLLVLVAPEFLLFVFDSWFHGIDLSKLTPARGSLLLGTGSIWFGFPSLVVVSWLSGWLTAKIYNRFAT